MKCFACNVDMTEHLGMERTCKALQDATQQKTEFLESLKEVTRILEALSYTNKFQKSQSDRLQKAKSLIKREKGVG